MEAEEEEEEFYLRLETRSVYRITRPSPNVVARHRLKEMKYFKRHARLAVAGEMWSEHSVKYEV